MAQGGKIDLRSILQLARRRKWFLIIPPIVALLGAMYRVSTMEPTYRSRTTILIDQGRDMLKEMSNVLPNADGGKTARMRDMSEDIQKQLLSAEILAQVVDRAQLKPSQGMRQQVAQTLKEHPGADEADLLRNLQVEWLISRLLENIIFPKRGNYVEISFEHKDPELAYNVVKAIADVFIETALKTESMEVQGTRKFSEEKEREFRQQYQEALARLESYQMQLVREEGRSTIVNATNLPAADARLHSLNVDITRQQQLVQELAGKLGGTANQTTVNDFGRGAALYNQMLDKASRLSAVTMQQDWKSPDVIRIRQDIADLREQYRMEALKSMPAGTTKSQAEVMAQYQVAKLDLDLLNRERKVLEGYRSDYQRRLTSRPAQDMRLAELQKQVNELAAIVGTFEDQTRGTILKEEFRRADAEVRFRVIDPANRPVTPITDDQNKIILIAIFGGLGCGIGAVYLLEFFDHSFKSVDEIENFLGLNVLGTIPKISPIEAGRNKRL
ncbi:hypothetical protein HUU05_03645 [candidate division KSB1 bacterium]|nr:hypothetical protein [candidate division KSB1 bacterium]